MSGFAQRQPSASSRAPNPQTRRTGPARLLIEGETDRLTHYVFRYPAKFHPPVVRALIERYTTPGGVVLDPFCGSGTLLVEASVLGRSSLGIDIDPVAVLVSQAKVHRYKIGHLRRSADMVLSAARPHRRPPHEYQSRMFLDLSDDEYAAELQAVQKWVPAIPNLAHWFRHYVVIDLANIRQAVEEASIPESHRLLVRVAFASIIRNCSNADPVPVSGLEVTAYMKKREAAGRIVDPFLSFERALERTIGSSIAFQSKAAPIAASRVFLGDASQLGSRLPGEVDAVITSPPYHGAVDYYRRHQLEQYWLGLIGDHQERLELLHGYIGRPKVPQSHPYVAGSTLETDLAARWERRIRRVSSERANAFRHYLTAMSRFFTGIAPHLAAGSPAVLVLGHSSWNDTRIPTTRLFEEISKTHFDLGEVLWYPVKNRYMSYSRRNAASIDKEYVLVLRRNGDVPQLLEKLKTA